MKMLANYFQTTTDFLLLDEKSFRAPNKRKGMATTISPII